MARAIAALSLVGLTTGCTFVGQGEGEVKSEGLAIPDCWNGAFDLAPDFFASVPFRDTQQLRIQHGSDLVEVSDGLAIVVNETSKVRGEQLGQELAVGLPRQLLNEIAPAVDHGPPPDATMALYLQFSCHNQNVVLYALEGTIRFDSLFSGDPNETSGEEKFTDAEFSVMMGDPRNADPDTFEMPPGSLSPLNGWFQFHFQRGQPGQPFP